MNFKDFNFNVNDLLLAFAFNFFGKKPKNKQEQEEYNRLVKKGLIKKQKTDVLKNLFNLGIASSLLGHQEVKNWGLVELKRFEEDQPKLSKAEEGALDFIRAEAEDRLASLFGTIRADISNTYGTRIVGGKTYQDLITPLVEQKIKERKQIRQLASDIYAKTGERTRDLFRIAFTETHNSYSLGTAVAEVRRVGKNPDEIWCAKLPRGRGISCPDCIRLYLKPGSDEPKIFKLSELLSNSNVKKKRKQWKPVSGSTHPFCACVLIFITDPSKIKWDAKNRTFVYKPKIER